MSLQNKSAKRQQRGFVLISVVMAITLLAAVAFMLNYQGASDSNLTRGELERDQLRYIAEAGLAHAEMQLAANTSCAGYTDIAETDFAGESYSVSFVSSNDSPVTVESTALPGSGAGLTLRNDALRAYQAPTEITLQFSQTNGKDTLLDNSSSIRNYGGSSGLAIESGSVLKRPVLEIDVSGIPAGATIRSARLELRLFNINAPGQVFVHRMTREWVEGTKNGGGIADGATWDTHDGTNAWTTPGGDFDSTVYGSGYVNSSAVRPSFDITALVQDWVSGAVPNHGMILVGDDDIRNAGFASRDTNNPLDAPKLIVTYACECGKSCGTAPPAGKNVLLVVPDAVNLAAQDAAKQALIEGWGHTVNLIDDNAAQAEFDAAYTVNDVVYVSEEILTGAISTKLRNATIGVVFEEQKIPDELGVSSAESVYFETSIDITDNTHYITETFSTGALTIVSSSQEVGDLGGTLAPGLEILARRPSSTRPTLAFIETGGALFDGGAAEGRRVKVPWGGNTFDITALTADGETIMKRSIEWGAGAGAAAASGPIAHWKLDDGTGATAIDSAGGNDGTLQNGPTWAAGSVDGALDFDGLDDHIDLSPHAGTFNSMTEGTIAAWINKTTSSGGQSVFALADTNDSESYVSFRFDTSSRIKFHVQENNTDLLNVTSTASVSLGEWHHIAVTVGSSGNTLYIDGVAAAATYSAGDASSTSFFDDVDTIDYAAISQQKDNSGPERWFSGLIDDVRLYDRALTGAEIAELAVPPPALPIAHWKLDEGGGSIAVDSVGGHDGTLTNGPVWISGQVNGGLNLDGSNDFVNVPHDDGLSLSGVMSFSAWVNSSGYGSSYQTILTKDEGGAGSNYYFGTWQNDLVFGFFAGGFFREVFTSGLNLQAGNWYHVAATFDDGADTVRLYLDGAEVRSDTLGFSPTAVTADLTIGRSPDPGGERWPGVLDDIRIYDELLSAAEVAELAGGGGESGGGSGGGSGGSCNGTFRDSFDNVAFNGSNGTIDWSSTLWSEVGESDGPASGDVLIRTDSSPGRPAYSLQIQDNNNGGEGVARLVDLSGAASASLSFSYRRDGLDNGNDYVSVSVSTSGLNGPWIELPGPRIEGGGTDSNYFEYARDLSAYIGTNTAIRLLGSPNLGNSDRVYFDDIQVSCSP